MSGGFYDYKQHVLDDIAESIQLEIEQNDIKFPATDGLESLCRAMGLGNTKRILQRERQRRANRWFVIDNQQSIHSRRPLPDPG